MSAQTKYNNCVKCINVSTGVLVYRCLCTQWTEICKIRKILWCGKTTKAKAIYTLTKM